jgi:hypothetical protein
MGVDGQRPVSVLDCGGIGAVFSAVELGEFSGQSAEARLEDLAWLGPRVWRHEAVIERVMRQAPVLPARFATLFTSVGSLERSVLDRREAIGRFFAQLGRQQEWAVKGMLRRAGAPAAVERPPAASPGARYMQQKRSQAQWQRDFNSRLKDFCRQAAEALGADAGGFRERKLIAGMTPGEGAETLFHWAFLLTPEALVNFRARLDRLNGCEAFPGLLLAPTGPWPAYTFAPDLSAAAQALGAQL